VYVPASTPGTLPSGPVCGCIPATGGAITSAITDVDGSFTLTDPPSGSNIPLVIQLGKWRRQIVLQTVPQCMETDLTADQTRLPRNHTEGDMPTIAVSTVLADQLECLFLQLGIDQSEFGTMGGGHIQMFADPVHPGITMASGGPLAAQAAMIANLMSYDHVMFSCTGYPAQPPMPSAADATALTDYGNAGGQVLLEHYHSAWITASPEWHPVATFNTNGTTSGTVTVTIDATFPAGQQLATWMQMIGASTTFGQFPEMNFRNTAQTVDLTKAQPWIHLDPTTAMGTSGDEVFAFPSSSGCGRVIFSDMHVAGGMNASGVFPAECTMGLALDPQQDALGYLFFDEKTCLQ
jgi:hypothetical protein